MSGTLQVGGITLGTHNSGTGKVDITNAGTADIANATITAGTIGSGVTGSGLITMFDQFYLENTFASNAVVTPWTRVTASTHSGYSPLNTGLTESSGVFSFPETGLYLIQGSFHLQEVTGGDDNIGCRLQTTIDGGSSYKEIVRGYSEVSTTQTTGHLGLGPTLINCTNTTNVKFRWVSVSISGDNGLRGTNGETADNQDYIYTTFTTMRIGPSQ